MADSILVVKHECVYLKERIHAYINSCMHAHKQVWTKVQISFFEWSAMENEKHEPKFSDRI